MKEFLFRKRMKTVQKHVFRHGQFLTEERTVMCSVDYDNYSGDLSEAPAEPLADDPDTCL